MQRAFVIRPFGKKLNSAGRPIDFEEVSERLIGPALAEVGLAGRTTGEIVEPGNIREDMFALIIEADLVVCDITIHNANVFYELGIRHALRKTRTVMIKGRPSADAPPFDLLTDRYQPYSLDDPAAAKDDLVKVLNAALSSIRATDSPIFKMLPTLREVEPSTVAQVVPMDLIEEVDRARAARSKGWLRLLAADVDGRRFQWPALRLIGQAQWELEDWEGARTTFDRVRISDENDIPANLGLANIYERQYRKDRLAATLRASDQAIERVLARSELTTVAQRAEALSLRGRNRKTEWRLGFAEIGDVALRRKKATNRALRESYEAYREAYQNDLNHFWSGLAALQMGWIARDLCRDKATWRASFATDEEADQFARRLKTEVEELRAAVTLAVRAALGSLPANHKDRVWAEMSPADLDFMFEPNTERVIRAYEDAIPRTNRFAWGAAKGQLELFASLGLNPERAASIIAATQALVENDDRSPDQVVVFAGHQVDEPDRSEPRFPESGVPRARALIRERLEALRNAGGRITVLGSAAAGADILCHELCRELGITTTICLPMPKDRYSSEVFRDHDAWRSRFLQLAGHLPILHLSDRDGLPRWLNEPPPADPWERGNRWVLEMALASGAPKVTLLALWDGKDLSGRPGGTGHMVRIAKQAGLVNFECIDSRLVME